MISLFYEILNTIRQNKMRTFLTGFAVAWGIFMLIVLLGSGNGLKNGFSSNFGNRLMNVVQVSSWRTQIPYAGFQTGRRISLDDRDIKMTSDEYGNYINFVIGNINLGSKTISNGAEYLSSSMSGVSPNRIIVDGAKIEQGNGRFINDLDIREKRKTVVISQRAKEILFDDQPAVGKTVNVDGIIYTVVGVYYLENRQDVTTSYIPISTAKIIYNRGINLSNFAFTLNENIYDKETNDEFMNNYRKRIAQMHQVSPEDDNAIWYWNRFEDYLQMATVSKYINIAVWIIGIFTLFSGIVGVSNIMLITVRERTREFGIRKSIGASPLSILKLVIVESIFITTIFGYIGLVCGVGVTEFASQFFEPAAAGRDSFNAFLNPTVDMNVAVQATLLLIIAGTVAGFFPALKAVKIKTIEALNNK
ncbi:MAG: ABC transporter permease [Prevotellaceae bacterium]|jgi:putative ABC transport system permease protein|nr:ABC transporter permease [Prevotellaceae bacterium]